MKIVTFDQYLKSIEMTKICRSLQILWPLLFIFCFFNILFIYLFRKRVHVQAGRGAGENPQTNSALSRAGDHDLSQNQRSDI